MKTLKELKGVKVLSKTEQKSINGGFRSCHDITCVAPWCCVDGTYCMYGPKNCGSAA